MSQTDYLLHKEEGLIRDLEVVMEQEELIWFQKSREKHIALGDRNKTFFHTSTVIRRRRNRIETLQDGEGRWISNQLELENLAIEYYTKLYRMDDVESIVEQLPQDGFVMLKW